MNSIINLLTRFFSANNPLNAFEENFFIKFSENLIQYKKI